MTPKRLADRRYYWRHRDAKLAAATRYAATHREQLRRYRASRRDARQAQAARWRATHRDALRAYDRAHYDADTHRRRYERRVQAAFSAPPGCPHTHIQSHYADRGRCRDCGTLHVRHPLSASGLWEWTPAFAET